MPNFPEEHRRSNYLRKKIRIAIPNKGRIKQPAIDALDRGGITVIEEERTYISKTSNPNYEAIFARANDIPVYVHYGSVDLGITGHDLILEREADVLELLDLEFGKATLVLAVPEDSSIKSVNDIPALTRIATEFPTITRKYFEKLGKQVEVLEVNGTAELAPKLDLAQMIVDITSTGETLRKNKLRIIGEILNSTCRLACNKIAYRTFEKDICELQSKLQRGL
ncbi:ATP phosphoribosyltransferase [Candidatus Bathyarchaeota archaeon]|nr:ATP phosphoribosyltransferase [Candidatus Bathyarchaeota archaeon]